MGATVSGLGAGDSEDAGRGTTNVEGKGSARCGSAGNTGAPDTEFSIGANFGAGLRFWLSKHTSLRIDIQELLFYGSNTKEFETALHLHAGFGFAFGGDE